MCYTEYMPMVFSEHLVSQNMTEHSTKVGDTVFLRNGDKSLVLKQGDLVKVAYQFGSTLAKLELSNGTFQVANLYYGDTIMYIDFLDTEDDIRFCWGRFLWKSRTIQLCMNNILYRFSHVKES